MKKTIFVADRTQNKFLWTFFSLFTLENKGMFEKVDGLFPYCLYSSVHGLFGKLQWLSRLIAWYCCRQDISRCNEKQEFTGSSYIFPIFKYIYCYLILFELVAFSTCYHWYTRTRKDKLSINDFLITFFWKISKTTCISSEAKFCYCNWCFWIFTEHLKR